MCHSHHTRGESHGETIGHGDTRTFSHSRSVGVSFGTTTMGGEHSTTTDDLVEREAHSLAAQLTRLADVMTVREFAALHLKIDGTFDALLFDDGSAARRSNR